MLPLKGTLLLLVASSLTRGISQSFPFSDSSVYFLFSRITSRNLQPWFYQAFRPLIKKSPTFLSKTLDKFQKICGEADWLYSISIDWRRLLCYLLIPVAMPLIKILSYLNSLNFILTLLHSLKVLGIISCSSSFLTSITIWCRMLRETPLYAILSGFPFGDTLKRKAIKLLAILQASLLNFFLCWNAGSWNRKILFFLFSGSINSSS